MTKRLLGKIDCPSTEITGTPRVTVEGLRLSLAFSYLDEADNLWDQVISFEGVRAYRKRAEGLCSAWHIEDAYDSLTVITPSEWLDELRACARPEWRDKFPMNHYLIFLDSFGALEVAASEASILPSTDPGR